MKNWYKRARACRPTTKQIHIAFPADLMRIMDQFGHCASPYRASFQIILKIKKNVTYFLRRIWYERSLITLRTNLNWFLSLFSLTQGESRNCRSRRRSNTSATGKTNILFPCNVPDSPLELVSMVPPPWQETIGMSHSETRQPKSKNPFLRGQRNLSWKPSEQV